MTFMRQITPRFHQLDPAGIVFFGGVFTLCSDVWEEFIADAGFTWNEWFASPEAASPVRQATAEYERPLRGGEAYEVQVTIGHIGTSSMEARFAIERQGIIHCRVRLVHVFVDTKKGAKIPVPARVREAFSPHLAPAGEAAPPAAASQAGSAAAPLPSVPGAPSRREAPEN